MIYILVTPQDEKQFGLTYEGQTQEEIDAMLPVTYPGATWQVVDEATYNAFMEEHRITA